LESDRISIRWGTAEYHGDAMTAQDLLTAALKSLAGRAGRVAQPDVDASAQAS
jgi:hypothetical protein